jgi:S1-C subfamily serine protease
LYEQSTTASSTTKWKFISILLIGMLIFNIGLFVYLYRDFQSQFDTLQTQFTSLHQDFLDNQLMIAQLQQQLEGVPYNNHSWGFSYAEVFTVIKDSVVLIKTRISTEFGLEDYAQGSGFIYSEDGYILTNYHVIEDADEITVTFTSGNIAKANIIGTDPYSDIAVIKVETLTEVLSPVILGNSSELVIGEPVVAVGNPYGLSGTITAGIISQVGRELSAPGGYTVIDVIQLDAAINPGNSGGPLVNMRGEVIGMNTAIVTGSTGVGFAIPSDTIKRELESLLTTGGYVHSWVGISGNEVTPEIAQVIGLNYTYGILIAEVVVGGPADNAGLRGGDRTERIGGIVYVIGGDVIIGLDGMIVRTFSDLSVYLEQNTRPGMVIQVLVMRNNQKLKIEITLGERPLPEHVT